jgi:Rrf2 family cysteine metabolism transcriptional repressor
MRLSTRGRYASRAMLELALHYPGNPLPLSEIAGRQDISERYLEQLMVKLATSGLVKSMRGKRGGFSLARAPAQIRLDEIIQIVEGSLAAVPCVDDSSMCGRSEFCVTHEIWIELKNCLLERLSTITLEDMVIRHRRKLETPGIPARQNVQRRPSSGKNRGRPVNPSSPSRKTQTKEAPMNCFNKWLPVLIGLALMGGGCSDKKSTDPTPDAEPGKITATASGITGQNGSTYLVAVYVADWFPGSTDTVTAGFMTNISSDSFSSTEILHSMNSQWTPSAEEKVFDPGTYSVVFFVAAPGSPPQYFTEIRLKVNGDVTATAPAWANWTHP